MSTATKKGLVVRVFSLLQTRYIEGTVQGDELGVFVPIAMSVYCFTKSRKTYSSSGGAFQTVSIGTLKPGSGQAGQLMVVLPGRR